MNRRALGLAALVLALGLAASQCAESDVAGPDSNKPSTNVGIVNQLESSAPPQPGGRLVYGTFNETNGWNPTTALWNAAGLQEAHSMFDTLSAYDEDARIQPFLAEKFEHNEDFTRWVIVLRPGVKLHNGMPVTSEVVKRNQDAFKKAPTTSPPYDPIDSFDTDGDLRVVVRMKAPYASYPYSLATQIGVVSDPDWLEGKAGRPNEPVATGPFKYDVWIPDNKLVVTKNPDYWRTDDFGNRLPYLDEVEFRPIGEESSKDQSLRVGDIQIMQTTDPNQIKSFAELARQGEYQVFNNVSGETPEDFVQTNAMAPPLNDVDARRALAYATNKQQLADTLQNGLLEPANGPYARSSHWYTPDVERIYPQYDLDKAKALVDQVKAKNGGAFSFTFMYPANNHGTEAVVQLLEQQWIAAGMDVKLEPVQTIDMILNTLTGNYQTVLWSQFDSPDPIGDSVWWQPDNVRPIGELGLNFARNKDERIGKALEDARHTDNRDQQLRDYQEVQRLLAEDVPYIWLFHIQITIVARNNLVNVVNYTLPPNEKGERKKGLPIQQGYHQLAQVWIKK